MKESYDKFPKDVQAHIDKHGEFLAKCATGVFAEKDIVGYYKNQMYTFGDFDSMDKAERIVRRLETGKLDGIGKIGCPPDEFMKRDLCSDESYPKLTLDEKVRTCDRCWQIIFDESVPRE